VISYTFKFENSVQIEIIVLVLHPEGGGGMFLQNFGIHVQDKTVFCRTLCAQNSHCCENLTTYVW
jgi:hypothetical protein